MGKHKPSKKFGITNQEMLLLVELDLHTLA